MIDLAYIRTLAAQWRQTRGYADKGGVIVVYQNEVQGWVNELRDPQHWQPGCIATDSEGNQWATHGGNDQDGAAEWRPLNAIGETPDQSAEGIKQVRENTAWPVFIPKKLSDDPRYRECQAKEIAARRSALNRGA